MSTAALPAPTAVPARMARLLRARLADRDGWVSTEAGVRRQDGTVLRPAVLVALGPLPHDGIVDDPPLLVVEVDPALLARWYDVGARAVWGRNADGAVVIARGVCRSVRRGATLTVPGHPGLRLAAAELLRAPSVGNVIHLPR